MPEYPAPTSLEAGGVHTRTYAEYRLTGQPNGNFPLYDCTVRAPDAYDSLLVIWEKIQSGQYQWTDARLERREVTITTTPWEDISDLRIAREGA